MPVRTVADTARWMAYGRALESERADAIFHDPHARRLAGTAGAAIWQASADTGMIARAIAVRTAVLDELILQKIIGGEVDLVLNLAAGLDARPWRLPLPEALRWIDVDLPELLDQKGAILGEEVPACRYEALGADVTSPADRARIFAHCGAGNRALVLTEGLLVYLQPSQVSALAAELHRHSTFRWWLTDLAGPRALELLQRVWGPMIGNARFQFGPADSAAFFGQLGWRETTFRSSQQEARRLRRATPTPLLGRVLLRFASAAFREEIRRLSGFALFTRVADETR